MGQIIQAQCAQCDFQQELYVGGGLLDCNLDTILSALPDIEQTALTDAIAQGAKWISITREPCSCDDCLTIFALPVVTYTLNDQQMELLGVCPQCGSEECSELEENADGFCPNCGGPLRLRPAGHWD